MAERLGTGRQALFGSRCGFLQRRDLRLQRRSMLVRGEARLAKVFGQPGGDRIDPRQSGEQAFDLVERALRLVGHRIAGALRRGHLAADAFARRDDPAADFDAERAEPLSFVVHLAVGRRERIVHRGQLGLERRSLHIEIAHQPAVAVGLRCARPLEDEIECSEQD